MNIKEAKKLQEEKQKQREELEKELANLNVDGADIHEAKLRETAEVMGLMLFKGDKIKFKELGDRTYKTAIFIGVYANNLIYLQSNEVGSIPLEYMRGLKKIKE